MKVELTCKQFYETSARSIQSLLLSETVKLLSFAVQTEGNTAIGSG